MQTGENNQIDVIDVNKKFHQILLMVKEKERTFKEKRWDPKARKHRMVTRRTGGTLRKFLLGLDERQLFMCQVDRSARSDIMPSTSLRAGSSLHPADRVPRFRTRRHHPAVFME